MRSIYFELFSLIFGKERGRIHWNSAALQPLPAIGYDANNARYLSCKAFLLLIAVFLLGACKTVPILDRNTSDAGGYWEQDENTDPRFIHDTIAGNEEIGMLYVTGNHVIVNGARLNESSEINNNTFVSTGPQSGVRIEFKDDHSACLIQIQDFSIGRGYGDTANCQHNIATTHANSQTRNSIYHFNVSQQQTKITVLRGAVKLALQANPSQMIQVNGGEEAILTNDSILGPRSVSLEEIKKRVRWRDNYQFYKSEVDWQLVGGAAAAAAAIGAAVILHKSDDDDTPPTTPTQRDSTQPTTQSVPAQRTPPQTPTPTTQRVPIQIPTTSDTQPVDCINNYNVNDCGPF